MLSNHCQCRLLVCIQPQVCLLESFLVNYDKHLPTYNLGNRKSDISFRKKILC